MSTKSISQFSNFASLALAILPLALILAAVTSGAMSVVGL